MQLPMCMQKQPAHVISVTGTSVRTGPLTVSGIYYLQNPSALPVYLRQGGATVTNSAADAVMAGEGAYHKIIVGNSGEAYLALQSADGARTATLLLYEDH